MDKVYNLPAGRQATKSAKETQRLGIELAQKILKLPLKKSAVILGLQGNLGGGKTTFLQGFAKGLGIKEKILSPTFVICKKFKIPSVVKSTLSRKFHDGHFFHFDCYRINKPEEILELGLKEIISDPKNIVAIEWPEKIKKVLPEDAIIVKFTCPDPRRRVDKNKREIIF